LRFKKLTRLFLQEELEKFNKGEAVSSNFIETYFKQKSDGSYI
jgi:hypothetical protein